MVKRLKTQLEKAVLTTKLQVAGAEDTESSSSGTGGGFKSSDRNIFIAGVSNCNNNITSEKVFECLQTNYNTISNSSNNGSNITSELRKQLANDYKVATGECGKDCTSNKTCEEPKNLTKKDTFRGCLDSLQQLIRKGYQNAVQESRKNDREK
jgi:hypothetical protein